MKKVRERLIDSAKHLFSARGYHGVSVIEITARAKTNVSLVSYYFGGKSGLLKTLFEELTITGREDIKRLFILPETHAELKVNFTSLLDKLCDLYVENSESFRIFLNELESGNADAEMTQSSLALWGSFVLYFDGSREKGLIPPGDSRAITAVAMGTLINLIQNKYCAKKFNRVSLEDKEFRRALIDQIVGMCCPQLISP